MLDTWLARLGREGERGRTEFDNHLAPWDIAFPELETIGDAAPSTELDGFPVGRAGVLVFRAGVGDAADGDGEEGVGVGEGGGVVAEELSAWGSASGAGERTAADVPGAGTRVLGDKAERDGLDAGGEGEARGGAAQGGKRLRYGRRHLFLQLTRGMEEAGRGKRSDENSARGAPRGTGVPVRNKYSPPRKWPRHHFCRWLVCEVQCFLKGVELGLDF